MIYINNIIKSTIRIYNKMKKNNYQLLETMIKINHNLKR